MTSWFLLGEVSADKYPSINMIEPRNLD
jgi:hypothetical protein